MMKKIIVNHQKCTGCKICMLICSFIHTEECNYHDSRIRILSQEARGRHTPILCKFCEDPPCVNACPMEALSRSEVTGSIDVNTNLCNGCQLCINACPYGAMFFNEKTQHVFTCDLCHGDPECVKVCQLPQALVYT